MTFRKKILRPIEVHVERGGIIESIHNVDAVVVDSKGDIIVGFGANESSLLQHKILPRSAIKPIQALFLMESGAAEKYSLTKKQITLACASHSGDDLHTSEVKKWHQQLDFNEDQLVCGVHWPSDKATEKEMIKNFTQPCRYHNNCSGKHTGMLTGLKSLGLPLHSYEKWDHPLQQNLRQILSELSGEDFSRTEWGVDGCGIPTYAMTLPGMARALSRFLQPNATDERQARMKQILEAIQSEPHYLSGKDNFCTTMIENLKGRAIVKTGAEGVYAAILPQSGVAIAVKVRDGATRASKAATAFLMKAFGGMTEAEWVRLSDHTEPKITNWAGDIVGKITVPTSQFEVG